MDFKAISTVNIIEELLCKSTNWKEVKYLIKIDGYQVFKRMSVSNNHFFKIICFDVDHFWSLLNLFQYCFCCLCFGFMAMLHVGSNHTSCIGRWSLNHCTAREVPNNYSWEKICSTFWVFLNNGSRFAFWFYVKAVWARTKKMQLVPFSPSRLIFFFYGLTAEKNILEDYQFNASSFRIH